MSDIISTLTSNQLRRAADLKEKIEASNKELTSLLGASAPATPKASKKGGMSAAGRASVAAAQRARWAKIKASKLVSKAPVTKRKMSATAKAKLSAMAKARWAKVKAAGKKSL